MKTQRIQALTEEGYCQTELIELTDVELRDLFQKEFPTVIYIQCAHPNGGTMRSTKILSSYKKAA